MLAGVSGDFNWISHIMKAIEEADQVELPGVTRGSRELKMGTFTHPGSRAASCGKSL